VDSPGASPHFLGLVTIGHSFGAQVLLKSVTSSLEDKLQKLNPHPAYLRGAQPAKAENDKDRVREGLTPELCAPDVVARTSWAEALLTPRGVTRVKPRFQSTSDIASVEDIDEI
jgi:hypothetical protein